MESGGKKTFKQSEQEVEAKRPLNGVKNTDTKKILLGKAKFAKKTLFFAWQFYTLY